MGNYKPGSDLDLALIGDHVTHGTVLSLNDQLNELTNLPYYFDIIDYNAISNLSLKTHIDHFGILIWDKNKGATSKTT